MPRKCLMAAPEAGKGRKILPREDRPSCAKRQGLGWVLNRGALLLVGSIIRIPGTGEEMTVIACDEGGATVCEKVGRSKRICNGLTDEEVVIKESGRKYRISARSEVQVLVVVDRKETEEVI